MWLETTSHRTVAACLHRPPDTFKESWCKLFMNGGKCLLQLKPGNDIGSELGAWSLKNTAFFGINILWSITRNLSGNFFSVIVNIAKLFLFFWLCVS